MHLSAGMHLPPQHVRYCMDLRAVRVAVLDLMPPTIRPAQFSQFSQFSIPFRAHMTQSLPCQHCRLCSGLQLEAFDLVIGRLTTYSNFRKHSCGESFWHSASTLCRASDGRRGAARSLRTGRRQEWAACHTTEKRLRPDLPDDIAFPRTGRSVGGSKQPESFDLDDGDWAADLSSSLPMKHHPACPHYGCVGRVVGGGEQLEAFDLDDGEWAAFSEGIARLATEQVRLLAAWLMANHLKWRMIIGAAFLAGSVLLAELCCSQVEAPCS